MTTPAIPFSPTHSADEANSLSLSPHSLCAGGYIFLLGGEVIPRWIFHTNTWPNTWIVQKRFSNPVSAFHISLSVFLVDIVIHVLWQIALWQQLESLECVLVILGAFISNLSTFSKDICFQICFKYIWNFHCIFTLFYPAAGVSNCPKCRKGHGKEAKPCLLVQRQHQPQATENLTTWKSRNGLSDISGFLNCMVLRNSRKAFHMVDACE